MKWSPWTVEQERGWRHWLSKMPAPARKVARAYPPNTCYRNDKGTAHYVVMGYAVSDETGEVTVKAEHGSDSFLPGILVLEMPPEDLRPCGCEEWEAATEEQLDESRARIREERSREKVH